MGERLLVVGSCTAGLLAGILLTGLMGNAASDDTAATAAPGYVPDERCASCHAGHYEGFQDVGMAQSFTRPENARVIEDFDAGPYFHEPSQRYYRVIQRDRELWFERFQIAPDGGRINELELKIDWVLGSGNRARSYLVQTDSGEMYMLPIGWYTEIDAWRMSPGFDQPDHLGLQRQVKRECMFCHNAYPNVPAGNDAAFRPHVFPDELPEGIGCQRCHGPGEQHIARVDNDASVDSIREVIVNPAKLEPKRRDDVCFQCHMLPEVAFTGIRAFGRDSYSFRPGQRLPDYIKHMEVEIDEVAREDNFQINHHAYRLIQSRCFRESDNELTCISCHNPHQKPDSDVFRDRVAGVCADCHASPAHPEGVDSEDCVTCHMPQRRTRDVIHVSMTDHRIARGPFDRESLLAPMRESTPDVLDAQLLDRDNLPPNPLPDLYRALATLQAGGSEAALDYLERRLPAMETPPLEAVLWLARAQVEHDRFEKSLATLAYAQQRQAPEWFLSTFRGLAYLGQSEYVRATPELRRATELLPQASQPWYNLGLALYGDGRPDEALSAIKQSLGRQPMNSHAWFHRGLLEAERGETGTAIASLKKALAFDPAHTQSYAHLVQLLIQAGKESEADRYYQHGQGMASDPGKLHEIIESGERSQIESGLD